MNIAIAILTLCIAAVSYGLYFHDMFKGKTKPHSVTWLIWAGLNGFIFSQQLLNGAGPGAWVTGAAALANAAIFALSFKYGEKKISMFDWLCIGLVVVVFGVWLGTADSELTILAAISIFMLGLLPTVIKAHKKPSEETALTFLLNGIKFLLAFYALETVTFVTAAYPLSLFVANTLLGIYLLKVRAHRKHKARHTYKTRRKTRSKKA